MAEPRQPLHRRAVSFFLSNLDSVAAALKYLLPSTFMGVLVGWSVWFAEIFKAAAPASYVVAGLLAWFLTVLGIWLLSVARSRNQIMRFREGVLTSTRINPLAPRFMTERIRMADLSPPVGGIIRNKVFDDCELIGPANVMFYRCHFRGCGGEVVDALIVKSGISPTNGFGFENCTFINCRFYLVTFMIPEPQYQGFSAWNWGGLNWLTDLPPNIGEEPPAQSDGVA